MQYSSENCCILGIRHAVSSKAQGTVKVRKFREVRNLNSTPILICNPGLRRPRTRGVRRANRRANRRTRSGARKTSASTFGRGRIRGMFKEANEIMNYWIMNELICRFRTLQEFIAKFSEQFCKWSPYYIFLKNVAKFRRNFIKIEIKNGSICLRN